MNFGKMEEYEEDENPENQEEFEEDDDEEFETKDEGKNDKLGRFNEIANKNKNMVVKPVSNDHYDIAYEMNESVDDENVHMANMNHNKQQEKQNPQVILN